MDNMDILLDKIINHLTNNDMRILKIFNKLIYKLTNYIINDNNLYENFLLINHLNNNIIDYIINYQFAIYKDNYSNHLPIYTSIYCGNNNPSFLLINKFSKKKFIQSYYYQYSNKFNLFYNNLNFTLQLSKLINNENINFHLVELICDTNTLPLLLTLIDQ